MWKKIFLTVGALTIFVVINSVYLSSKDTLIIEKEKKENENENFLYAKTHKKRSLIEDTFTINYNKETNSERFGETDINYEKIYNNEFSKIRHDHGKNSSSSQLIKRKKRCRRYSQQYYKPYQRIPVYVPNYNSYGNFAPPRYIPPQYIVPPYVPPKCRNYCVTCPTSNCIRRCPNYPEHTTEKPTTKTTGKIIIKTTLEITCNCDKDGSKFPTCNNTGVCVCKPHYIGNTCDTCKDGYWKNNNKDCVKCHCNELGSVSTTCNKETGKCHCKPGVSGDFCDFCLPHFYGNVKTGCKECDPCNKRGHICDPSNGKCVCPPLTTGEYCQHCVENSWGYEPEIGCKACNCFETGSVNLQCDRTRGKCTCQTGFEGEKCDRCSFGYYGYPNCKRCNCDQRGTAEDECRSGLCRCNDDGNCNCKENVKGKNCDVCKSRTFGLTKDNPKGCIPCFCFGRSNKCVDAPFNWDKIRAEKAFSEDKFVSTDLWRLGSKFMGDLTTSYGGYLSVNVTSGDFRITLEGNGVKLQSKDINEIQLIETNWQIISRNPRFPNNCQSFLTRDCFMTVLQNVTSILIEATSRINEVLLDKAKPDIPTYPPSRSVEKCECPKEYAGLSCQDPNEGYYRYLSNNPKDKWIDQIIGRSVPCQCNGRSKHCDANTGYCKNCTQHTTGLHCELCDVGYYKDKAGNCSACLCPTAAQNNAESCSPRSDSFICKCKRGYKGQFCDKCDTGYFDKDPSQKSMQCEPCGCNPYGSVNGSMTHCNKFGICQCRNGFKGEKCNECVNEREYIKNGICTPCDECTQLLFSEIDNLTIAVEKTFGLFKDGISPPWKVLTDTMKEYHMLSGRFNKKKEDIDNLLKNNKLDQYKYKIETMENLLKKENEIADKNTNDSATLLDSSNKLARDVQKLKGKLKKIIENLENFGTKHINLKDALNRARKILQETEEISQKFDEFKDQETFDFCSNVTQRINNIYKPPENIPKKILDDLNKKLNDIIAITATVENICNTAEAKNKKNSERIENLKDKIAKINKDKENVNSTINDILMKINATKEVAEQLEVVYEDLKKISEFKEFKEIENRVRRQMKESPQIEDLFIKALDHVQELENKINKYQSIFNFTKDEWKKINASGAYEALINGIKEAKKNVELSRKILQDATKIIDPVHSDSIVDRANLAHAFSDRLKQRINNLKNISKSLNLIKNKLDDFKYSILESGKANNDLNQILHKMELDITSQGYKVAQLEEAIRNSTDISDEMQQIEKKVAEMQLTSQYNFFKKYKIYLNLTSNAEINNLKSKLKHTRKQLEALDISSTYFDNVKKYNIENKNKDLKALQEKIDGLRNKIYYAKQAADSINVALNITNCLMSYKLPQTEIFQSLSVTYSCRHCVLFKWSNKHNHSLTLKVEGYKPVLVLENKEKIIIDNTENKEKTVNIEIIGSVIRMQLESIEQIKKIGSYYYIIDSDDVIKIGSLLGTKPPKGNAYVYKVMLNERNFGLWKFTGTEGLCTGQKRDTSDRQPENINTYFNGKGYHIYGRNKKLNPTKLTLGFDFSTFDENSLIYLAKEENCVYIALFLENGYLNFYVTHTNGVNSTMILDNKYNNGTNFKVEITMEYNIATELQNYILLVKNEERKQATNTISRKNLFKIKNADHYIGGIPPTFNKTCIPVSTTSFLGFLEQNSQLTNESLAYGVTKTSKTILEFYQAWFNKNGYLKLNVKKGAINSIGFILRPVEPNGVIINLPGIGNILLKSYKIYISEINYLSDIRLGRNEYNLIHFSLDDGILKINDKEDKNIDINDEIIIGDIIKIGDANDGFTGGISNIAINEKIISFNPDTVNEFTNVEIGRERPLVKNYNIHIKSLSTNITNSMQNTEGCAAVGDYITDPDAVKFGDKPDSYTHIKTNFWKQNYKLSFEFRTFYPNGVLFISASNPKQQLYNLLELKEGKIHFTIKGKKKTVPITLNNKLNDGHWHTIEITKKKRKLIIVVDEGQKKSYRVPKNMVRDEIYLGGIPLNSDYSNIKDLKDKLHPFRGCMKSLVINEQHKFLLKNNKDVIHSNIRQCFPNIEEGAYFGGDAFAIYKDNFQVNKILELSFEFRTPEQNGILLSVSNFRNFPALSVELQNGAVVMAVNLGNGGVSNVINNLDSEFALCNNMWHNVTALYTTSELTVNVDGIRRSWVLNDVNSLMDELDAPLYIGGLPDNAPVGTLKSRENFKGCIRKLKIEDRLMDWSDMTKLSNVLLNSCPVESKDGNYRENLDGTNYTLVP